MKYLAIENQLFIKNRTLLLSKLDANCMAVFNSNDIMPTNADGTMPFKQNNDLFWLTGVDQEESILIIYPDNLNKQEQEIDEIIGKRMLQHLKNGVIQGTMLKSRRHVILQKRESAE